MTGPMRRDVARTLLIIAIMVLLVVGTYGR